MMTAAPIIPSARDRALDVLRRHGNRGSHHCACGAEPVLRPGRIGQHRGFIDWHREHIVDRLDSAGLLVTFVPEGGAPS